MAHLEPAAPRQVLRGIGLMLVGMLLFAANDTLGKIMLGTYSVGQLMLVRGGIAFAIMLALLRRDGLKLLAPKRRGLQMLRFALGPAEASLFFWALITLPLAEVITYYLVAPIWVTAISGLLLGEPVGWRRWSAVLAGFAGVVIALHPAGTVAPGALSALLGSALYAVFLIATGRLPNVPRSVLMAQQSLATLLFGCLLTPFEGWTMPGPTDAMLMLVLAIGSLAGNVCVNYALKLGPAVTIIPFQYTMLPWGLLLGFVVFGDLPASAALLGGCIIIGAGLFIFLREQQLASRARARAG